MVKKISNASRAYFYSIFYVLLNIMFFDSLLLMCIFEDTSLYLTNQFGILSTPVT